MSLAEKYTTGLLKKDGILYSKQSHNLSYPEDGYNRNFGFEDTSFWYAHRAKSILSLIQRFSKEKDLMDVGGGNGFITKYLQTNSINSVLLEPSKQGSLNAKKRGVRNIVCSTLSNAGIQESSIPSIGLFDVLEHIENDDEFIKNATCYLQENGYFYISIPTCQLLFSGVDLYAGHFKRYSLQQLKSLLENNGLEVVYMTHLFSILVFPIFALRSLPYILGKRPTPSAVKAQSRTVHNNIGSSSLLMKKILNWENERVKKGKSIPLGSSGIVVARKKPKHPITN